MRWQKRGAESQQVGVGYSHFLTAKNWLSAPAFHRFKMVEIVLNHVPFATDPFQSCTRFTPLESEQSKFPANVNRAHQSEQWRVAFVQVILHKLYPIRLPNPLLLSGLILDSEQTPLHTTP
jgi:hypothetical protein